jgi:hypothetical protein
VNEEALAHWGAAGPKKKIHIYICVKEKVSLVSIN